MGSNPGPAIFFYLFLSKKWDKKWVLACPSFGECTARVKLDLTDFKKCDDLENAPDFSKPYLVGTELTSG